MATAAPSAPEIPEILLEEVRHHLSDTWVTGQEIISAHNQLELDRIGIKASVPLPFMPGFYIDSESGKPKEDKITKLSETIQAVRRAAVEALEETERLRGKV